MVVSCTGGLQWSAGVPWFGFAGRSVVCSSVAESTVEVRLGTVFLQMASLSTAVTRVVGVIFPCSASVALVVRVVATLVGYLVGAGGVLLCIGWAILAARCWGCPCNLHQPLVDGACRNHWSAVKSYGASVVLATP